MTSADDLDLHAQKQRAIDAANLLENPLIKECFVTLRQSLIAEWVSSDTLAIDKKEKLHLLVKLVGKAESFFVEVLNTGRLAAAQLDAIDQEARQSDALHAVVDEEMIRRDLYERF
jgi:hypothetical protein